MSDAPSSNASSVEDQEKAAAQWLVKIEALSKERGTSITIDDYASENTEFAEWLQASPGHRIELLRLLSVSERANRLAALAPGSPVVGEPPSTFLRRFRTPILGAIAAGFAIIIAVPVIGVLQSRFAAQPVYETKIGSRETVRLDDGSTLELNADTKIQTEFSQAARTVTLEKGEAFFDIARDETRPFRVIAGDQTVTVLGTKFSVHRRNGAIEVAVEEGRVEVAHRENSPMIIGAGDIATVKEQAVLIANRDVEAVARELSWRQGYVVFDGTPLEKAADEFNRYNRTALTIADAEIAQIRISGRFRAENVDEFVGLLADGFNLNIDKRGNNIEISK